MIILSEPYLTTLTLTFTLQNVAPQNSSISDISSLKSPSCILKSSNFKRFQADSLSVEQTISIILDATKVEGNGRNLPSTTAEEDRQEEVTVSL